MKHIYLITFLFFTSLSFAQNDLLGEWFIHYTNIDGNQQYSTVPNSFNNLIFEDTSFHGSVCSNGHDGSYTFNDDNTITITSLVYLNGGCNYEVEIDLFLHPYLFDFLNYYLFNPEYSYTISGSGANETLTLTNGNGDFVVYGRTQLSEIELLDKWYLNYHSVDGTITNNEDFGLEHPFLDFSNEAFEEGLSYVGFICNFYEGAFTFDNTNSLVTFNSMSVTQQTCSGNNSAQFEVNYLSNILNNPNLPSTLEYSITGEGNDVTLVLTNLENSNFAVFGKYAQPSEIFGSWYLNQIEVNNVIHPNYYNTTSQFELEFFETTSENEGYLDFLAEGPCDSFGGTSVSGQNNIVFTEFNFTLLGPCSNTPEMLFETIYFSIFENQSVPFDFQYVITGENDEQILTITNPLTGDEAIYGRTPNTEVLTQDWYLSRIEIPGNPIIQIPGTETDSPSITLTNDINPLSLKTMAFGDGDCNAFMSDYEISLTNGNNIQLLDFSPTLAFCTSDYEDEYFNIIGDFPNNLSEFEITTNGTVLRVTDVSGASLFFGDEPLSILENDINAFNISIKNNPVGSKINLSISQPESTLSYQIYSIEGKLIKDANLNSETINVEYLNSGLYFIRFSTKENQTQTIKFIKQ